MGLRGTMKNRGLYHGDGEYGNMFNGTHLLRSPHMEKCTACGFKVPESYIIHDHEKIPCSEYHTRCARCRFPVANTLISLRGLCNACEDTVYYQSDGTRHHKRRVHTEGDES